MRRVSRVRGGIGRPAAAALALAIAALLASAAPASAATFTVSKKGDPAPVGCAPGSCSLREAIRAANERPGADVVVLPAAKGAYRIARPDSAEDEALDGDLDVTGPLTIRHPGPGRATIDAGGVARALDVHPGAPTTLRALVIRGGRNQEPDTEGGGVRAASRLSVVGSAVRANETVTGHGGGIGLVQGAGLRLERAAVVANVAGGDGGGIDGDSGSWTVRRATIAGNRAGGDGGGIYFFSSGGSRITRTTVAGNSAGGSGGGLRASAADQDLRIVASTVAGNEAGQSGGGIEHGSGDLALLNSTIAGNRAVTEGGAMRIGDGDLSLNAVTVARNRAASGGGLVRTSALGLVAIENSLIVLNRGDAGREDCAGEPFGSLGSNLLSAAGPGCEGFDAPGDRVRPKPRVGRLAPNGGPTETVALKRGSPAIGHARRASSPQRDQRGRKRDRRPDVGAFER